MNGPLGVSNGWAEIALKCGLYCEILTCYNSCLKRAFSKRGYTLGVGSCHLWLYGNVTWPLHDQSLVWWQLWNFPVVQLKFNRFLHLNQPPKMIFCYLARHFDSILSKVWHFQFSESIFEAKIQLDLPENDFLIWILN